MRSNAYRDFLVRAGEARYLVNGAIAASSPEAASALAKGAAVLTAASLERYVNDFLRALCKSTAQTSWSELSEGQKRYMSFQIAVRARMAAARLSRSSERDVSESARSKFSKVLAECSAAFENPSLWGHHRDYGMFMDGAAEPTRIDKNLRLFIPGGRGFLEALEERGRDRITVVTALQGLIDARHGVAHALTGVAVGPNDVRVWLRLTKLLVRDIEAILWTANDFSVNAHS